MSENYNVMKSIKDIQKPFHDFIRAGILLLNLTFIKFKTDSVNVQSSSNTCKNYLLKIYSQHGNFFNTIKNI